ncbi:MAG TPA: phospholipid carrier-dependent glycosyltransferase, partial [Thermoanaerobaculia bacterium]
MLLHELITLRSMRDSGRTVLLAALALLLLAVWLDPPGSWLAEPDEPRYAEIPREMLASGDWVVPRLNGVPYFEKPPLLYWANASAMKVLGNTNFAARLATRVAGLGTLLFVWLGVGRLWGRRAGLIAAVFFLVGPLPFTFSRLNLTDGVLTFFFTATVFGGFATLRAKAARRPWLALSAGTGAAAAGAFLSKGLVGIVLPGGILFFWALSTRQGRALTALLLGPALPVFLALSLPWLWLAEKRVPGFLNFFFIHEHFQRFATPIANRPGPIYYFVVVFVAGFLPALGFFFRGLRGVGRKEPEALLFVIWFAVVLLFFSVSHSKLSPYLFPAFPPAAALAARGLQAARGRGFGLAAALSIAIAPLALAIPAAREAAVRSGILPVV